MRCPSGGETAITFTEWASGSNWRKTTCTECGTALSATPATYVSAGLTLAIGLFAAIMGPDLLGLDLGRGGRRLLIILPVIGLGAVVGFIVGGYRLADE